MSAGFDSAPPPVAGLRPVTSTSAWPLAWIGLGLLWLLLAAGWLVAQPALLTLPHFHPWVVGWVHLWLPGGLLAICIGACYQLMPVVLGPPLRGPSHGIAVHFTLHAFGITTLALSLATGRYLWAAAAGIPVVLGTMLLWFTAARTWWFSTRRDVVAASLPLATGWLLITALSGVLLALNRRYAFLPTDVLMLLRAHAHAGLAGFFLSLLQGMTFQLIPMFTLAELRAPRALRAGFWTTQLALPALAAGWVFGWPALTTAAAWLLAAGLGASAYALTLTLRTRRRRQLERPVLVFLAGGALAGLATVVGVALVTLPWSPVHTLRGAMTYGVLLLPGALSLLILGMLGKILPFLVWLRAYGPLLGKTTTPLATQLGWPRVEALGGSLLPLAALVLASAALTAHPALAQLGAVLLAAALVAIALHAGRIAWHLLPSKSSRP